MHCRAGTVKSDSFSDIHKHPYPLAFTFKQIVRLCSRQQNAAKEEVPLNLPWLLFCMGYLSVCPQECLKENKIQTEQALGQHNLYPCDWECKLKQQYCGRVIFHNHLCSEKFKAKDVNYLNFDIKNWMFSNFKLIAVIWLFSDNLQRAGERQQNINLFILKHKDACVHFLSSYLLSLPFHLSLLLSEIQLFLSAHAVLDVNPQCMQSAR